MRRIWMLIEDATLWIEIEHNKIGRVDSDHPGCVWHAEINECPCCGNLHVWECLGEL